VRQLVSKVLNDYPALYASVSQGTASRQDFPAKTLNQLNRSHFVLH